MAKSQDAFRTISEVADWLDTPAHVLRFWESRFTQVKPVKRAGGRRYYRPADMELLSGIKKLLHHDGMTIKGVQKLLRSEGIKHVAAMSQSLGELAGDSAASETKNIAPSAAAHEAIHETPVSQVISFPPVEEIPVEEIRVPQPQADDPRQASFLDEAAEEVPNLEPKISAPIDPPEPIEQPIVEHLAPFAEEPPTPDIADTEMEAIEEPISEVASLTPTESIKLAQEETQEAPIEPEAEEPVTAQVTSLSKLTLPDASEIPEVGGAFEAPKKTPVESTHSEDIPPSVADIPDEKPEPQIAEAWELSVDSTENVSEETPPVSKQVEEQPSKVVEELEIPELAEVAPIAEPKEEQETNQSPEPVVETTPEVSVPPIIADTPSDPQDTATEFDRPSLRSALSKRAAPFSPDKKAHLSEVAERIATLRQTYGTVSKASPKN